MAFWDFLHDANSEKKAAGATWNFLKSAVSPATNLVKADVVAPAKEVVAQATGNRVAQANAQAQGREALSGERQFLQSIPRGVVQLGQSVVGKKTVTPSNTPFKFLAGTEPIQSIPQVYSQARNAGHGIPFAFGVAGLTAATDSPVGPGKLLKGGAKEGVHEGLQRLAKASTEQDVRNIMKGTPPEIIDKVAPAIAQTKDPNIIQNIIQKASESRPSVVENAPTEITQSPDHLSFLKQEALKYKSADEFVKNTKPIYHGTNADIKSVDQLKPGHDVNGGSNLIYASENPEIAQNFGKNVLNGRISGQTLDVSKLGTNKGNEFAIPKGLEDYKSNPILTPQDRRVLENTYFKGDVSNYVVDQKPEINAYLRSKGYTNVKIPRVGSDVNGDRSEIIILDNKALHTDKQLTDIYNQAHTSSPTPKADITPVQPPTDPFNDINDALNGRPASSGTAPIEGIKNVSRKNAELLSHERGARFTASKAAGASAEGSQGYFKELSQLKGKYNRVDLGGMIENLGPDQAENLFAQARQHIQSIPDATYHELGLHPQAARLNTQTAIRKVIFGENGGVPTASELKLIKVASPSLAKDIESKLPVHRKLFDLAAKLAGVPRALQSTGDLSMGGRQGLLVAARHPVLWARANKESVKYLKSDDYFKNSMAAIRNTPEYELGHKYGLATPAADNFNEEAYASADLVKKIPGVNKVVDASERAYNGGLTKLRTDLWSHTLQAYGGADKAEEVLGAKGMRDLAEAVNTLTGRGGKHGGLADKNINSLSTSLFSPRLWAARLNTLNPQYYARLSPAARKVALENAGAFAAVAGVVLGAASAMGAEVNTDARSSDFLKIKIGDTRYDIFGGLQQNIVFAWREISGEKKNSQTGDVTKFARSAADIVTGKSDAEAGVDTGFGTPTRLTQASDLVSNKLSPTFAFGAKVLEGKNRGGEPFNVTSKNPFENEIAKLFIPINLQGAYDTSKNVGSIPKGVALNAPDTFGIGTQTYGTENLSLSDKQKSELQIMKKNGASDADIKSTESFYQTLKGTPSVQHAGDKINRALAKGDLQGAQKIADDHNEKLAKNLEKWFEAHRGQTISKAQADALDSAIIELDSSSLERRLSSIQDNPVKYGG